jgi:hypothetical protein
LRHIPLRNNVNSRHNAPHRTTPRHNFASKKQKSNPLAKMAVHQKKIGTFPPLGCV